MVTSQQEIQFEKRVDNAVLAYFKNEANSTKE